MTRRDRGDQEVTSVPVAQRCAPRPCQQAPTPQALSPQARNPQAHATQPVTGQPATGQAASLPCRAHDGELWFAERPEEVERAKALCGDCPLRVACLDGALERREPWGVWGGELLVHGAIVARKRPRGRPRKHPVAA